jgi:hypothetical protein
LNDWKPEVENISKIPLAFDVELYDFEGFVLKLVSSFVVI